MYASLSLDKSQYERGLNEAEKSGSSIGSRIGTGFAKVGKAVAVGIGAASTAVGALASMSVKGYSDYEQLAGGVETLFKKSSQSVINNASKAYQTAGMSANEYMETVTGFSASLLQSLGGDTQKAAGKADMAITDMSDNANKMGTDIESIQNAYQGFAKQNYTMLDNLKLGYGGTKEEMERLLEDATKLSGVEYDISSYADIVDAIHVVQTEIGITGTTAEEASTTIQGSIQSAKSAWQNLITGLADDNANLDELVNNFFNSIVAVGENIIPRISVILNGITGLIQKLAPEIIQAIPGIMQQVLPSVVQGATALLTAFVGVLPELAKMILDILPDLIAALEEVFKGIVDALPKLVEAIAQALPTLIPQLITAVIDMVVYLMEHFSEIVQPIIEALPDIIVSIVTALIDNLPTLIEGAISLVLGLVKAIPKIILGIVEALPTIIEKIITGLIECIPQLIEGAIELVLGIIEAIPKIIVGLIEAIPKIIEAVITGLIECLPKLIEGLISLVLGIIEAIPKIIVGLIEAIPKIIEAVITGLIECLPKLIEGVIELVMQLVTHLPEIIIGLIEAIPKTIVSIGEAIVKAGPELFGAFGEIFGKCWEKLQEAFSGIGEWFSGIVESIRKLALEWYIKVRLFFQNIWNSITGVFSKIGEFFSNIFSEAVSGIKNTFSGIKQWFSNLWQGIWNAIKTPINWIIDGINAVIGGLNSLKVDIPDWVPFVGGQTWGVNIPKIAKLAKGGFVKGGTPFIAGEAGAEAVIPLENNNQWIYKFAHAFADGLNSFYDGDNLVQSQNKGASGKIINVNLYLDNVNVKNDDDIEVVANKVSERIAEKLIAEGMAVG